MKSLILMLSLLATSAINASELDRCADLALSAPEKDGYHAESDKYSTIPSEESKDGIIYIFRLVKKENEHRKVAAVETDASCKVLSIMYYGPQ